MTPEPGSRGGAAENSERDALLDRLYGQAAGAEPPAQLDAAILAAARREVGAGPRLVGSRIRQWGVPVSIAAVVVLSASLVILVREEGGEPLELRQPPAAERPSQAEFARPAPQEPAPAAVAPKVKEASEASAGKPSSDEVARERRATRESQQKRQRLEQQRRAEATAKEAQRPQPFPEATSDQIAAPAPGKLRDAPAAGKEEALAEGGRVEPGADAAAPRRMGPAEDANRPLEAEPAARPAAPPPPTASRRARAPAPAASVQGSLATGAAEPGEERLAAWVKALDGKPPEQWLDRIRELKRRGAASDAAALLAEFKRRFPDYPLDGLND